MVASFAVLINTASNLSDKVKSSLERAIRAVEPTAIVDFYDPIEARVYPEPGKYDSIVLSGGTIDPAGDDPWVQNLRNYIRDTVTTFPKQRFIGICWGHQLICVTFGGEIGEMEKAEIGVTATPLTKMGLKLFPFASEEGELKLHEHHRREIKTPAKGFIALAENNKSFLSDAHSIVTFQGHPELDAELAAIMLDKTPEYMGVDEVEKEEYSQRINDSHQGPEVWGRIIKWATKG